MQTEHIKALFSKKLSEYLSLGYERFSLWIKFFLLV